MKGSAVRLSRVRIRDYRPVNDSGEFEIEPGKTLLVGVNEAGKTALLKALQQVKAPPETEAFNPLRDYPRARYVTDIQRKERSPSEVRVVEATFALTDDEKQLVLEAAPAATDVTEYTRYRYLDNSWKWNFGSAKLYSTYSDIQMDLKRLRAYLATQDSSQDVIAALDGLTKLCRTGTAIRDERAEKFSAWLQSALPFIEEGNAAEEERYNRLEEAIAYDAAIIAAHKAVRERVPLFVYYSTYFTVRGSTSVLWPPGRKPATSTQNMTSAICAFSNSWV